jgi:hypothetical protein
MVEETEQLVEDATQNLKKHRRSIQNTARLYLLPKEVNNFNAAQIPVLIWTRAKAKARASQ